LNTKAITSIRVCRTWRLYERIHAAGARTGIILLLILIASASVCPAAERNARHHLQVELFPKIKTLRALDEITIEKSSGDRLDFKLSHRAEQIEVMVNGKFREFDFEDGRLRIGLAADEKQRNDLRTR
jgi:hypothetical protein